MIANLDVIAGPMFAGKTSALIRRVEAAVAEARRAVVIIKPAMDNRYADQAIVTHDGVSRAAVPVSSAEQIFHLVADAAERAGELVHLFADEVQFFEAPYFAGEFHMVVHALLLQGHAVTCGGLATDWRGMPFDVSARLMAMADAVEKLTARCAVTGAPAQKTYKKAADSDRVALGSGDTYEPRSNHAWEGQERVVQARPAAAKAAAAG